jgi:hypothetical protein
MPASASPAVPHRNRPALPAIEHSKVDSEGFAAQAKGRCGGSRAGKTDD